MLQRIKLWALFGGPWRPVLAALAWPHEWLQRKRLAFIAAGGDVLFLTTAEVGSLAVKTAPASPSPESAAGTPQPVTLEQVRELLQEQRRQLLQELRQAGVLSG